MNKQTKIIAEKIIPLLKKYGVIKAGIFGSYARGEQKKNSDIDILVKTKKGTDLIQFIELKLALQDLLGMKVDLVEYSTIRKELKKEILDNEMPMIR